MDQLCVKVVIDPSRAFSATKPGDVGTITIRAGFTIDNGPLRTAPNPIRVTVSFTGSTSPLGDRDTDADGTFTVPDVLWPTGVDAIKIDIVATLTANEGGIEELTQIARFDRITKHAPPGPRLVFTFDHGLDGRSAGVAGPKGTSNWGTVKWVDRHCEPTCGAIELDGTGVPSQPNSWIFRTFTLPANVTSLRFDVSAHDRIGADTRFRVRLVVGGTSHTLVSEVLTHSGPDGDLSFRTQSVSLVAWAGQTVTLFFEQNDNGVNGRFPGANEQVYLDNIRISTS